MLRQIKQNSGMIGGLVLLASLALLGGCSANKPAADTKKSYVFWPKAPSEPRVQFLVAYSKASDVREAKKSTFTQILAGEETEADMLIRKPYGVAMWNGCIYVCDTRGGGGIVVLDLKKQQTRVMGAQGQGMIQKAVDVAVAPDGTKYVAEMSRGAIYVFDAAERFIGSFTAAELNPVSLAVSGEELFVVDFKGQMVRVLDRRSGKQLRTIGEKGSGDGQFARPLAIAVDKDGHVLVTDVMNCRVLQFTREGKFLQSWGRTGARPGDFVRPKHIATSSDGLVFVVDAAFNNVQAFDEEGKVVGYFGAAGNFPGAMDLPAGVCVHESDLALFAKYIHPAFKAERLVIVTNQFGPYKVSVYAVGQLREGKTVNDLSGNRLLIKEDALPPGEHLDPTTTRPVHPMNATPGEERR